MLRGKKDGGFDRLDVNDRGVCNDFLLHKAWGPNLLAGFLNCVNNCQAEALAKRLALYGVDRIFSSTSNRAVMTATPTCDLLKKEPNAIVRAVLGHFFFGYIHPYMDGNGRMCRFLMNVMLASGGYDWVVITTDKRAEYMAALESASVKGDILPFARFVISMIQ